MFSNLLCSATLLAATVTDARPTIRYSLGRRATNAEIQAYDISVDPAGRGLPAGSGTAVEGQALYDSMCASCHGEHGEGSANYPTLVGGRGSLNTDRAMPTVGSYWPYATTVWDYIRRAMPYPNPGSLSAKQVYSLTAYILFLNGIVGPRESLTEKSLPAVRMPNRNGFVGDPRPDVQ